MHQVDSYFKLYVRLQKAEEFLDDPTIETEYKEKWIYMYKEIQTDILKILENIEAVDRERFLELLIKKFENKKLEHV
jgi:hypothetical protein